MKEKINMVEIGCRLKSLRKKYNLTQEAVAQKLIIDISTLSRIENGHQEPSILLLGGMTELYHASYNYLLFGTENDNEVDLSGLTSTEINSIKTIVRSMQRNEILK